MTAAQLTRLDEAQDRLAAWTFETPAAVGNAAKGEIDDSVATTIFNAWQVRYVGNVIGDELAIVGESPEINVVARAVLAMIEAPEELVSGVAPETGEALLCDDLDSPGNVESCTYWMIRSLDEALDWATNEGFSSPNMDDWRWGYLHTLTLESMLPTDDLDVPPPDDPAIPGGYPRHGDNYSVDSSDPGNSDFDFSYGHGPAIRHVTEFTGPGEMRTWFTIPGGQTFDRSSPHYRDQMDLYWSVNEYFEMPFTIEDIKTVAEDRIRIEPLAVGGQ
jgi:penicillin amidase